MTLPISGDNKFNFSVDFDIAETTKEVSSGFRQVIPVLDRHPKGTLFAIALLLTLSATTIGVLYVQKPSHKGPAPTKEDSVDTPGIKKIHTDDDGNAYKIGP